MGDFSSKLLPTLGHLEALAPLWPSFHLSIYFDHLLPSSTFASFALCASNSWPRYHIRSGGKPIVGNLVNLWFSLETPGKKENLFSNWSLILRSMVRQILYFQLGCLPCNQSVFSQWNYLTFAVRPEYYRRPNNGLEDISREHDGKQTLWNPPWVTYSYFHFGMLLLEMAQIALMVGIYISILAY